MGVHWNWDIYERLERPYGSLVDVVLEPVPIHSFETS